MRPSCLDCGMKHISQAMILFHETRKGYPHHFVYAIGHLAEAEDELVQDYPVWTERIRQFRLDLMEGAEVDFDELAKDYWEFYQGEINVE